METETVRRVESSDPRVQRQPQREVLDRQGDLGVAQKTNAADVHKDIVARAMLGTRNSLAELKEGLSWYGILDQEDAEAGSKIADDIDNLIRRIKQHERK